MLIKVINPNTTASMTDKIGASARLVAAVGQRPSTRSTRRWARPRSRATTTRRWRCRAAQARSPGERRRADGFVLACFGDPGLDAARELAAGPVVGIAEAGMKTATLLGRGFSVVTTLSRTVGRAWDLAAPTA